jgi:hypothetical protein
VDSDGEIARVRALMERLATSKSSRVVGWDSQWKLPSDWSPYSVIQPESGMPFTPAGAWELIAELAKEGHPLRRIELEVPPGESAYEFLVDLEGATVTLYIKVQFKGPFIVGRSFHYSVRRGLHGHPRCRKVADYL